MPHFVGDAGLLDVNGTLIVEVVAFILLVLILARWVYPPIMRVATEREGKIAAGVRAAEESQKRLEEVQQQVQQVLNEARGQAREIVARAHTDATVEAEEVQARGRAQAEALVERARADITAERDRAIQDLRAVESDLVVQATARLLGQVLDRKAHDQLIEEALAKVADARAASSRNN